jgi:hypothetical protein
MNGNAGRFLRYACGLVAVMAAGWMLVVHAAKPVAEGFPTDWTHRHVIFSRPANAEQAQRVAQDTRYWQQWYRQSRTRALTLSPEDAAAHFPFGSVSKGLWEENMGTGAAVGASNSPAKYSFSTTVASCSDYVVFNTGLAGASTQASVIAYDNLYSGCSGGVPKIYWAYNTGGQVLTSPAISGDGTQVAFVQTSAGVGSLILLKFAASGGTAGAPAAISSVSNSSYRTCTAPCMTSIVLENTSSVGINDTTSSVFPDYSNDVIYVGGASSWLFKFSGVFRGTPAEVTTGGFPLQVNSTTPTALTSPIYDFQSGNVFVSDLGGFLYSVSLTAVVTASAKLDHGAGIVAAPVVDSTAELVYAFSSNDGSTTCTGGAGCSAVYVFKVAGFPGAPVEAKLGTGSAAGGNALYEADFDSINQNSSTGAGDMYVCGGTGQNPTLYRVTVADGTILNTTAVAALTPAANHVPCSPLTDVYNPNAPNPNGTQTAPEEWVFFGVKSNGRPTGCTTGCAISFVDLPWLANTGFKVGQEILVRRTNNNTMYINVAIVGGVSGSITEPAWPAALGTQTNDGGATGVTWLNQGTTSAVPIAGWATGHVYAGPSRILDTNGNVEITTAGGTSGGTQPTWPTLAGTVTPGDGTVTWINAGVWPVHSLASAGGVSGITFDNTVGSGTEAGASQIYFSNLTNQTCTTSATNGGCAIQASQSALK